MDGNITANGVIIGEKGTVVGKIIARSARIRGNVTGKVDAVKIELTETSSCESGSNTRSTNHSQRRILRRKMQQKDFINSEKRSNKN